MRLRRRVKVFVSYSHQDRALRDALVGWLQRNGCDPRFDAERHGIAPGKPLPLSVVKIIDRCEVFLGIGTTSFMRSSWCEEEVAYARSVGMHYLPVLCEPLPSTEIAPWFQGTGTVAVRYAECFSGDFAPLTLVVSAFSEREPAELSLAVLLLFFFLIGVPILGSWMIRQWIGRADREIRDLQGWVEELNRNLVEGRKYVAVCRDYSIEYQDPNSGEIVARDAFRSGRINRRLFYRVGREVANDSILFEKTYGDTPSLSKRREIYPQGRETGVLIEETFDSIGNLVTKRVRRPGGSGPTSYADIGVSIYPPLPFCPYR